MRCRSTRRTLLAAVLAGTLGAPLLPASAATATAAAAAPRALQAAPEDRQLGYDRIGVRRGDTWYLRDALDGGPNRSYAEQGAGWQPVAGDTDGDGNATVSLFRDGVWLLRDTERGLPKTIRFGQKGDQPVVGDWDGDGVDTIGLFRSGRWFLRTSNDLLAVSRQFGYGLAKDVAVVGDWDANGKDDIAVRRGTTWFQRDASSSGPSSRTFAFGNVGDVPLAGDWDHDGRDTPGLFRDGTWFFRRGSFPSPFQTTRFGLRGDKPVVRRTQGLAPGVRHDVVRDPAAPWTAHVATVDLAAPSSPETVLSQDRLQGLDVVSSMTRRAGAVLGVNGDFFLGSGRPVHLYANDGQLLQTPTQLGRGFGIDRTGLRVSMGVPEFRTRLTVSPPETATASVTVPLVNAGAPAGDAVASFDAAGALLETPPDEYCYKVLSPAGARSMAADGTITTPLLAGGTRCGGPRPSVPPTGTVLAADPFGAGGTFLRSYGGGVPATLSTQLGFAGAVDAMGGNPVLLSGGRVVDADVDQPGAFHGLQPRTAVGTTADGKMLVVVVDGRQSGYSRGMTMRELAELMRDLGAVQAINLDGGGSSVMVVNGLVASRPSEGAERPVSNGLVVLPGADPGDADLSGTPANPGAQVGAPASRSYAGPAQDPGSLGGLADALVRAGQPVSPDLRRAAEAFRTPR